MSNPGVIVLAKATRPASFRRFVVEDNIGESIHLHVDNLRIDFSVDQFLSFARIIEESLAGLELIPGYSLGNFDENFLSSIASLLPKLQAVSVEKVKLSSLRCIVRGRRFGRIPKVSLRQVTDTPAYKFLRGEDDGFLKYEQDSYHSTSNEQRLNAVVDSIKMHGYPYKGNYISIFNHQNIVRDGQHRAAALAYLNGPDSYIDVLNFSFSGTGHAFRVIPQNISLMSHYLVTTAYREAQYQYQRLARRVF
jgi:hypothetical protein